MCCSYQRGILFWAEWNNILFNTLLIALKKGEGDEIRGHGTLVYFGKSESWRQQRTAHVLESVQEGHGRISMTVTVLSRMSQMENTSV